MNKPTFGQWSIAHQKFQASGLAGRVWYANIKEIRKDFNKAYPRIKSACAQYIYHFEQFCPGITLDLYVDYVVEAFAKGTNYEDKILAKLRNDFNITDVVDTTGTTLDSKYAVDATYEHLGQKYAINIKSGNWHNSIHHNLDVDKLRKYHFENPDTITGIYCEHHNKFERTR